MLLKVNTPSGVYYNRESNLYILKEVNKITSQKIIMIHYYFYSRRKE